MVGIRQFKTQLLPWIYLKYTKKQFLNKTKLFE